MKCKPVAMAVALILALAAVQITCTDAILDNAVTNWVYVVQEFSRQRGYNNQLTSRAHAFASTVVYQAVKNANSAATRDPHAVPDLAVGYAVHGVLSRLDTVSQSGFLDIQLANFAANYTATQKAAAAAIVRPLVKSLFRSYAADVATSWADFKPYPPGPTSVGWYQWVPGQTYTLYPQLANSSTVLYKRANFPTSTASFLTRANPVGSPAYEADFEYVRDYGSINSTLRSNYSTDTAKFWLAPPPTAGTPGQWQNISLQLVPSTWDLTTSAKFFAALGASVYDSTLACWYVRFHVLKWRPITAIRTGNGGISPADPTWAPLLSTPYHPEYPSAHQCIVGGVYGTLIGALGSSVENRSFTINTEWPGIAPRSFTSLREARLEAAHSRVLAGAHYNQSAEDGFDLGRIVSAYNWQHVDKVLYGTGSAAKW